MQDKDTSVFNPGVPPDVGHAGLIRAEASDWLDTHHPGVRSFSAGDVLAMAGERNRRYLIGRLRKQGIGNTEMFSVPDTAVALTALYLRSKGVRWREAVDAARLPEKLGPVPSNPGRLWNRIVDIAVKRLRRRLAGRLLGSAIFSLLRDPEDHPNCMVIVKQYGRPASVGPLNIDGVVSHANVFETIVETPTPSCWVISPLREVLFLDRDQLPTLSEVRARHFQQVRIETDREVYELLLGTVRPTAVTQDSATLQFVGRILDIVFMDFDEFLEIQSKRRFDNAAVPELSSADDLQLWLTTQLLDTIYPGSLSEISETPQSPRASRVLASSVSKPWEPAPWDPPKHLEMLSGYVGRVGVPLIVEEVKEPWLSIIESVGPEMRFLDNRASTNGVPHGYSALALPIHLSSGESIGALYVLAPRIETDRIDVEVRTLTVISRIIGEIIERQRAAIHTATVSSDIARSAVLSREQFRAALLDMLRKQAGQLRSPERTQQDVRLPFLLLAAHSPDPDEVDSPSSNRLRSWLVETLRHMELRSFVRSHLPGSSVDYGEGSFIGELPGVGMMIALDSLVTKYELDHIREAFPTTINRPSPSNAPVRLLAYVLDVPAQRIIDAAADHDLEGLADEVERWAFDVATVVDDVAQTHHLAENRGDWDAALRRVRKALKKEGGRRNGYLLRIAADCSFSLGDWPSALKYAQQGVAMSKRELGGGVVRSACQEADAHLCLCDPIRAWDLYTEAISNAPNHPISRYHRGQGLLLMARLLREYENEQLRIAPLGAAKTERIDTVMAALVDGALEDLTAAADLLDRWGLVPQSYNYRNYELIPTMLGQGTAYMLARTPGPAATRLQGARRSFPKDDLFFREYLFAKCWEQGLHTRYGELLLGDEWEPLRERLQEAFGGF